MYTRTWPTSTPYLSLITSCTQQTIIHKSHSSHVTHTLPVYHMGLNFHGLTFLRWLPICVSNKHLVPRILRSMQYMGQECRIQLIALCGVGVFFTALCCPYLPVALIIMTRYQRHMVCVLCRLVQRHMVCVLCRLVQCVLCRLVQCALCCSLCPAAPRTT